MLKLGYPNGRVYPICEYSTRFHYQQQTDRMDFAIQYAKKNMMKKTMKSTTFEKDDRTITQLKKLEEDLEYAKKQFDEVEDDDDLDWDAKSLTEFSFLDKDKVTHALDELASASKGGEWLDRYDELMELGYDALAKSRPTEPEVAATHDEEKKPSPAVVSVEEKKAGACRYHLLHLLNGTRFAGCRHSAEKCRFIHVEPDSEEFHLEVEQLRKENGECSTFKKWRTCGYGDACIKMHVHPPPRACRYYLMNKLNGAYKPCTPSGDSTCKFSHPEPGSEEFAHALDAFRKKNGPCMNYQVLGTCHFGEACIKEHRHEEHTKMCKCGKVCHLYVISLMKPSSTRKCEDVSCAYQHPKDLSVVREAWKTMCATRKGNVVASDANKKKEEA